MRKHLVLKRTLLSLLVGGMGAPHALMAAPLSLAQYPAGTASVEPAPNVIVSVDDSGSMGSTGIASLKSALKATFAATNIPDNRIRLAWQSMHNCREIPYSASGGNPCGGKNAMKPLAGTHRTNFLTWVDTLSHDYSWLSETQYTPSHALVRNAGTYLSMAAGNENPWNATPGTADASPLNCRKAFHIFMTDGEWNGRQVSGTLIDASRTTSTRLLRSDSGNLDGTTHTLPDGTVYDTSSTNNQTRAYRDSWGFKDATKSNGTTDANGINTLADLAFYYWSTDLQTGISNNVVPTIKKSGSETFGTGASATTLQEYWNPKNNPATWQNLVTYTIGFNSAASLTKPTTTSSAPEFDETAALKDATYAGDYGKLITGEKTWPTPLCGSSGNKPCEDNFGNPSDRNAYNDTIISRGRMYELWHMAINGRGKFMPATNSTDLAAAFKEILAQIIEDTTKPITSFASTSTNNTRTDIGEFISGYDANGWKGYVRSDAIAKTTGARSANPTWGIKTGQAAPNDRKTTADKLDELSATAIANRVILTTNDSTGLGVSFQWETGTTKLSAAQKTLLNAGSLGEGRVNFIRGDRTKEASVSGQPFRIRQSRQGDIVNSNIWYVAEPASNYSLPGYLAFTKANKKRVPMIYVGGNDGMLHGFSAVDGEEKLAFIPKGVIANLPQLTDPAYDHLFYVDGSPFTGDVNWGVTATPDWRTLLVGALGAGGKGYFILDVTKPGTTDNSIASNFSTSAAADLVVMDKTWHKDDTLALDTTQPEADIGHIFAAPVLDETNPYKVSQITRMNNGQWAVVMGNGYNSANERPVLLIQFIDKVNSNMTLKRIVAATTGDDAVQNGLSAPRLVDINADGMPDVVYAGDLKGNLWKFDISSGNPDDWGVAFSGNPLYKAAHTSGASTTKQPITAPPTAKANDRYTTANAAVGGMMVAFGTGRNITEGDRTDTSSVHTIYSVHDNTKYKIVSGKVVVDTAAATPTTVGTGTTNLVQQTVSSTSITGAGVSLGRTFWTVSQNAVDFSTKKGWYLNLPAAGERLLKPMSFYDGSNNLAVWTQIPASGSNSTEETCTPSPQEEKQYFTLLNIMDGKKPGVQVMDSNGDGIYNIVSDQGVSRMTTSKGAQSSITGKDTIDVTGSDGSKDKLARMPEQPMRPSWRQLQ